MNISGSDSKKDLIQRQASNDYSSSMKSIITDANGNKKKKIETLFDALKEMKDSKHKNHFDKKMDELFLKHLPQEFLDTYTPPTEIAKLRKSAFGGPEKLGLSKFNTYVKNSDLSPLPEVDENRYENDEDLDEPRHEKLGIPSLPSNIGSMRSFMSFENDVKSRRHIDDMEKNSRNSNTHILIDGNSGDLSSRSNNDKGKLIVTSKPHSITDIVPIMDQIGGPVINYNVLAVNDNTKSISQEKNMDINGPTCFKTGIFVNPKNIPEDDEVTDSNISKPCGMKIKLGRAETKKFIKTESRLSYDANFLSPDHTSRNQDLNEVIAKRKNKSNFNFTQKLDKISPRSRSGSKSYDNLG